jgi:hypothetical protein
MHKYQFDFTNLKRITGPEDISFREYDYEKDAAGVMDVQRSMARFGSRALVQERQLKKKQDKVHEYVFERAGKDCRICAGQLQGDRGLDPSYGGVLHLVQ